MIVYNTEHLKEKTTTTTKQNRDEHFQKAEVVNFYLIHHRCRGDKLENTEKFYKVIKKINFIKYPADHKQAALSAANRCEKSDLWILGYLIIEHFKKLYLKLSF